MFDVCVMARAGNMTSSIKPLAPRGWAREQACAPVTPARLARSVGGAEPSHQETTGAAGGVGPSRQETMGAVGAPHAPKPLLQLAVCARSPGTTRATAVREV